MSKEFVRLYQEEIYVIAGIKYSVLAGLVACLLDFGIYALTRIVLRGHFDKEMLLVMLFDGIGWARS